MANPQQTPSAPLQQVEEILSLVRQQAKEIQELRTELSQQIAKQIVNSTKQIEAHQALQALVGDVAAPLHGWPISPDFGLQLVRLIRDNNYHLIVEFGSGTTTLLSLLAIDRFRCFSAPYNSSQCRLLAFEHLEAYHQKTNALVSSCSNRGLLDLRLSPLEPWTGLKAGHFYYSGTDAIAELVCSLSRGLQSTLRLLVVIDGPPGGTCHWARYPAVPVVLDAVSGMDISIDFLLDDMIRADERGIALAWERQLREFGLSYQRVDYKFEKGGLLLSIPDLKGVDTSLARAKWIDFQQRITGLEQESKRMQAVFRSWEE